MPVEQWQLLSKELQAAAVRAEAKNPELPRVQRIVIIGAEADADVKLVTTVPHLMDSHARVRAEECQLIAALQCADQAPRATPASVAHRGLLLAIGSTQRAEDGVTLNIPHTSACRGVHH